MSEAGQVLRRIVLSAALAGTTFIGATTVSDAADAKVGDKAKAVGGSNWGASVTGAKPAPAGSLTLDDKQTAAITDINGYFNGINELRGKFLQTDAEQGCPGGAQSHALRPQDRADIVGDDLMPIRWRVLHDDPPLDQLPLLTVRPRNLAIGQIRLDRHRLAHRERAHAA